MGGVESIPENIMIFTKAPTTVIGINEQINGHPHATDELDYEGELAIIIGKRGKQIKKRKKRLSMFFGYTIINDVTARDIQRKHKQFFPWEKLRYILSDGTVFNS